MADGEIWGCEMQISSFVTQNSLSVLTRFIPYKHKVSHYRTNTTSVHTHEWVTRLHWQAHCTSSAMPCLQHHGHHADWWTHLFLHGLCRIESPSTSFLSSPLLPAPLSPAPREASKCSHESFCTHEPIPAFVAKQHKGSVRGYCGIFSTAEEMRASTVNLLTAN